MNRKNSGDDDSFEKEKEIIAGRETVKRKEATRVPKVAEKLNLAGSKIQSWRFQEGTRSSGPSRRETEGFSGNFEGREGERGRGMGANPRVGGRGRMRQKGEKERGKWTIRGRGTPEEGRVNGTRGETEKEREKGGEMERGRRR